MVLSQLLLAYTDLGLFLAVIGVYVFFAALWLIYVVTERSEQRIKREIEDSVMGFSDSQRHHESGQMAFEEDVAAYGQEISDLRSELTAVREVAVASGQRLQAMEDEINTLRSEFLAHLDTLHGETPSTRADDVAIEMTRVKVPESTTASMRSELRLYNPSADAEENPVTETAAQWSADQSVDEQAADHYSADEETSVDPERGLIYTNKPAEPDNLTRIWGVGAVNQDLLNEHGIFFFEQVADWNAQHISKFNDILCFRGRIEREDWVGQAKRLVQMKRQESRAA